MGSKGCGVDVPGEKTPEDTTRTSTGRRAALSADRSTGLPCSVHHRLMT
jgi:hypothetical protein